MKEKLGFSMDLDEPLDFEAEDSILKPSPPTKKRRKLIGLDDLLTDHFKEKDKRIEKEGKKKKIAKKCYSSDEDEEIGRNRKEAILSKFVSQCEKQVQEIRTEDKIPLWDLRVFGNQKTPPPLACPQLENCMLLHSFMNNELNSVLELSAETGPTLLEGLLINGWLQKLIFIRGHVEESVAAWTFNLMLYSLNEGMRVSACDFWCSILLSKSEVDQPSLKVDWYPAYAEVQRALVIYGYQFDPSIDIPSHPYSDSDSKGPPQNIRCWIRFLATACQVRNTWSIFSNSEVEELLGVIISFFLDRRLEALSLILYECMLSVIGFFSEDEWNISRVKVAKFLATRVEKDLNCLRLVECISGVDTRSKNLRSEVAFQILLNCFDKKVCDGEELLRLIMSVKVKDKGCDFFMLFIYLVLGENWLLFNPVVKEKPFLHEMWGAFLRSCSSQISSTDMRSYASKARYKASYLLQMTIQRQNL